jgi:hypothetical protein
MAHLDRPENPDGERWRPASVASPKPLRWESCVIKLERVREGGWLGPQRFRFVADAVGPRGPYQAGNSAAFGEDIYGAQARTNLSSLLGALTRRGWVIVAGPRTGPARGVESRQTDEYWTYRLQRATK